MPNLFQHGNPVNFDATLHNSDLAVSPLFETSEGDEFRIVNVMPTQMLVTDIRPSRPLPPGERIEVTFTGDRRNIPTEVDVLEVSVKDAIKIYEAGKAIYDKVFGPSDSGGGSTQHCRITTVEIDMGPGAVPRKIKTTVEECTTVS